MTFSVAELPANELLKAVFKHHAARGVNWRVKFRLSLKRLKKISKLRVQCESSPGHQIFITFQFTKTLS